MILIRSHSNFPYSSKLFKNTVLKIKIKIIFFSSNYIFFLNFRLFKIFTYVIILSKRQNCKLRVYNYIEDLPTFWIVLIFEYFYDVEILI